MKLKLYCILLYLLLSTIAGARVMPNQFSVNVPIVYDTDRKIIIEEVQINGSSERYRFIFDTGSSYSSISEKAAKALHIVAQKNDKVNDGEGEQSVNYSRKNTIEFAGIKFLNKRLDIVNLSFLTSCDGNIDGIIGGNIIEDCIWNIEVKNKALTVTTTKQKNYDNYKKVKLDIDYKVPYFKILLKENIESWVIFDSGHNTFFTNYINIYGPVYNNEKWADILGLDSSYTRSNHMVLFKKEITGSGLLYETALGNVKEDTMVALIPKAPLEFGKEQWNDFVMDIYYTNVQNDLTIGAELFDYYSIILDYRHKAMYLKRNEKQYTHYLFNSFGFSYVISQGNVTVNFIWNNSPAAMQGLELNDKITSINYLNIDSIEIVDCELSDLFLKEIEKQEVTLRIIKPSGAIQNIIMRKINLFDNAIIGKYPPPMCPIDSKNKK